MNNVVSIIQKWVEQGISVNHYYDSRKYDNNNLPLSVVAKDILTFYQYGGKQIYYSNSKDYKSDKLEDMISHPEHKKIKYVSEEDDVMVGCDGGACSI